MLMHYFSAIRLVNEKKLMESAAKALSMFLVAYYAFIFPLLLIFHFRSFQFLSFVITPRDPEDTEFGEKKLGRDTNTV